MSGACNCCQIDGHTTGFRRELARYLLVSIIIHLALFFLFLHGSDFSANEVSMVSVGRAARLQVLLTKTVTLDASDLPSHLTPDEQLTGTRKEKPPQGGTPLGLLPDAEPELVSELAMEIDDSHVAGFMILALKIDARGVASGADVVYSELPAATTDLLVSRFLGAEFRPAMKAGQAVEASILLRIDIE